MKRFGLTLMAALCLSATAFAAGNQPTTEKWEGYINVSKLSKYLQLSSDQMEEVANICNYFNAQMTEANRLKDERQTKMLHNAIHGNLQLMKKTLTAKQYARYAKVLDITLKNKGIELE